VQDRCHHLGQKKPVNIYRLVSENTIEEKIVERSQQKLKLDAVVVQQEYSHDASRHAPRIELKVLVPVGANGQRCANQRQ
jgi:SWI/SNF-related matrix-associated actin-dependent regulator of chromatin subfamily A member 5